MVRLNWPCVVAAGVLAVCASRGSAQQPAPGVPAASRPVFSPYLNLLRRDSSPAINYYGLVRPQLVTQGALQSLQQQVNSVRQMEAAGAAATDLPVTGQPVTFLNTGGYFLNNRVGVGPVSQVATTRPRPVTPPRSPARGR
jgi:hypothetical protein